MGQLANTVPVSTWTFEGDDDVKVRGGGDAKYADCCPMVTIFSASFCLQLANANIWPSGAKTHPDTGVTYVVFQVRVRVELVSTTQS